MAISVTSIGTALSTSTAGTTKAITLGASVPSGSLIVVGVNERNPSNYTGVYGSIADTASNTYTRITQSSATTSSASSVLHSIWYVKNSTALSSSNTITFTASVSAYINLGAIYATGIDTTDPLDTTACAVSASPFGSSTTTSVSVTSGSPTVSGELFVYLVSFRGGVASPTLDTTNGWTNTPGALFPNVSGTITGAMGYQINSGAGTKTNTTSWSGGQYSGSSIAGFKEATGAVVNSDFFIMF